MCRFTSLSANVIHSEQEMAQAAVHLDKQAFSCKICLGFLKDPATLPCGHNFCRSCIQSHWDKKEQSSCPQCRQEFSPRPALVTNSMLAELVEQVKRTALKYNSKGLSLVSDASSMKLQKKREFNRGQILHIIREKQTALEKLQQEALSLRHCADAAMRHSNQRFNTVVGVLKNVHSEVTQQINELQEREEAQLKQLQDQLQQDITELRMTVSEQDSLTPGQTLLHSPPPSALDPPRTYSLPLGSLEQAASAVTALTDLLQVTLRDGLQNISQSFRSDPHPPPRPQAALTLPEPKTREKMISYANTAHQNLSPPQSQATVALSLPKVKTRADFVNYTAHLNLPQPQKPQYSLRDLQRIRREDLINYAREIVLDPESAHEELTLSRGNRRVTKDSSQPNYYYDHPNRFDHFCQILSSEGLTGRCYWEVEWDKTCFAIAISYNNIKRKGDSEESEFGYNDKSWVLQVQKNGCSFWHHSVETKVERPFFKTLGVCVDHSAGLLAFYEIEIWKNTKIRKNLIHFVHTTFTQPLYAGVRFFKSPTSEPATVYFPKLK